MASQEQTTLATVKVIMEAARAISMGLKEDADKVLQQMVGPAQQGGAPGQRSGSSKKKGKGPAGASSSSSAGHQQSAKGHVEALQHKAALLSEQLEHSLQLLSKMTAHDTVQKDKESLPAPENALQLLFRLDRIGEDDILCDILRRVGKDWGSKLMATCKQARDIVRRAVSSVQLDFLFYDITQTDVPTIYPNARRLHLRSVRDSVATNLDKAYVHWHKLFGQLQELHLSLQPWPSLDDFKSLKRLLNSCTSLNKFTHTLELPHHRIKVQVSSPQLHRDFYQLLTPPKTPGDIGSLLQLPLFQRNLLEVQFNPEYMDELTPTLRSALASCKQLPELQIRRCSLKEQGKDANTVYAGAVDLILSCSMAQRLVIYLRILNELPGSDSERSDWSHFSAAVNKISELQVLDWTSPKVEAVNGFRHFPSLTSVSLRHMRCLDQMRPCSQWAPNLRNLHLEGEVPMAALKASLALFSGLKHLKKLSLMLCVVCPEPLPSESTEAPSGEAVLLPELETFHLETSSTGAYGGHAAMMVARWMTTGILTALTAPKLTAVTGRNIPVMEFAQFAARHPLVRKPQVLDIPANDPSYVHKEVDHDPKLGLVALNGATLVDVAGNSPELMSYVTRVWNTSQAELLEAFRLGGSSLQHICLDSVRLDGDADAVLRCIATHCGKLQSLALQFDTCITGGAIKAIAAGLPHLRVLALGGSIDSAAVREAAVLRAVSSKCTNLVQLHLKMSSDWTARALLGLAMHRVAHKRTLVMYQEASEVLSEADKKKLMEAGWDLKTEEELINGGFPFENDDDYYSTQGELEYIYDEFYEDYDGYDDEY